MKAIWAIGLMLLLSLSAARAQESCDTLECFQKKSQQFKRELDATLCLFEREGWERDTCLMRLIPPQRGCSTKKTPQEQIECLESTIDTLLRALPAIVADQVQKARAAIKTDALRRKRQRP